MSSHSSLLSGPRELTAKPLSSRGFVSVRFGRAWFGRDLAAPAAPALDDDGDQVRLLHRPHALDQLRDGDGVRLLEAEHDERFGHMVGQVGFVMKAQPLEACASVSEAA